MEVRTVLRNLAYLCDPSSPNRCLLLLDLRVFLHTPEGRVICRIQGLREGTQRQLQNARDYERLRLHGLWQNGLFGVVIKSSGLSAACVRNRCR